MLRNISEWKGYLAYSDFDFDYKSPYTFEYPAQYAWMYSTDPFTGYPGYSSRTASNFIDNALEVLLKSSPIFLGLFLGIFGPEISNTFFADPIFKIYTRLLDQPFYWRIWETANRFLEQCNYMSRFWEVWCVVSAIFAQHEGFSYFAVSLFSVPPTNILDYSPVLLLAAAGCFLRAAYKDFDFYFLNSGLRYSLKVLSSIISVAGIILTCTGSMSSKLRIALDCLAVLSFLKILLYYGNFHFGLEVSELNKHASSYSYYGWCRPYERARVWKPYSPWTFLGRVDEFERLEFRAFRFVPFGAFTLKYRWFVIATLPAVPVAVALSIWADDKRILLSIFNLLLLYLIAHTVLSTTEVILSMSQSFKWFLCSALLSSLMLEILVFFFTIPLSHVARFVMKEESRHGWSSIR